MSTNELDARIENFLKTKFKEFPELDADFSDKTKRREAAKSRRMFGSWRASKLFG